MNTQILLFKSLNPAQLARVIASDWRLLYPDTAQQQIFYPKVNIHYAEQIARQWDARRYAAGYVVKFLVSADFLGRYELQTVAYAEHREYKVPITELDQLNENIIGKIELVSAFTALEAGPQPLYKECVGYH